jgi:hypothetical protein
VVIGWDIGGVNVKMAVVDGGVGGGRILRVEEVPFELQRAPDGLPPLLVTLAGEDAIAPDTIHAVTMTAELSQMFRTKREGVCFVLDALAAAFPAASVAVFTVEGQFIAPAEARQHPLRVAAANWAATAHFVARQRRDVVLVDVGSTTTDIIPIVGGEVVAEGSTDPERLASQELVYTGVVRTPIEAIVSRVEVGGRHIGVSAEGFALSGDVHVWRGDLLTSQYDVSPPDGRPVSRDSCGERLLRMLCADCEMMSEREVGQIAAAVWRAQLRQVSAAIETVSSRHPAVRTAAVTGRGAFLAAAAAREAGLSVYPLAHILGADGAHSAPATAVALLFRSSAGRRFSPGGSDVGRGFSPGVTTVIKIGGSALAYPALLTQLLARLDDCGGPGLVIVPGGGPFADAVRAVDLEHRLTDTAAHWMAIRGMDQFAELLVARLRNGVLAESPAEVRTALAAGRLPVLAPSLWLRAVDPLPHSWDVTSDSIAAWVADVLGAAQIVLIKPPGAGAPELTDAHFDRVLPAGVQASTVSLDAPWKGEGPLAGVVRPSGLPLPAGGARP